MTDKGDTLRMVKCIECKKCKPHGEISSFREPEKKPLPIYICTEWPSPRDRIIMIMKDLETPLKCEYFETESAVGSEPPKLS